MDPGAAVVYLLGMLELIELSELPAGMPILVGGNHALKVPQDLAERFRRGDYVLAVTEPPQLLLVPRAEQAIAAAAIDRAHDAFHTMASASDERISRFYEGFAERLADDDVWDAIYNQNLEDVADAERRGRSTTRLVASDKLRNDMIAGLRGWIDAPSKRGQVLETVDHERFRIELVGAALGVVGFVFEGRPNVVADATGVLRGGNTVVFRIGRDALRTAQAIMQLALTPALEAAGLPTGAVSLVESCEHAAGWAMFSDTRLGLAVARGSGPAVATLGSLARQAGIPVSLHGRGGAWLMASASTPPSELEDAVYHSLDRKVCNTLNTCCIPRHRVRELLPALLSALERAGKRLGQTYKLHVTEGDEGAVPAVLFERRVMIRRAEGDVSEPQAVTIPESRLGHEWEWEQSPEVTLKLVEGLEEAIALFNRHSPQFVACLLSSDQAEHRRFYDTVQAPFVGDGFTRWVDGQYALKRPELGLSNWQSGRLFGRGGVLSGDTVYSVRTRAIGTRGVGR